MASKEIPIRLSVKDGEKVKGFFRSLGKEGQTALAKIEKASKPASKGLLALNAVSREGQAVMSGMAGRLGLVGSALSAVGPGGLAAAAGIAAVVAATVGLARATRTAVDFVAAIQDEAEQAGVTAEAFQELLFVGNQLSVSQDALTDGLKELNLRADEFAKTGKGPAAEAFKRLGLEQKDVNGRLKDADALFREVIRRMEKLDDTAAEIRVADELFGGTGGEQFVRIVNAGSEAIAKLREEAREMGLVIDSSLIARADEARDRLAVLERVIDVQLNSALVDLAPVLVTVAEAFAGVARWVGEVVDGFRDIETRSKSGLQSRLAELNESIEGLSGARSGHQLRNLNKMLEERERIVARLKALEGTDTRSSESTGGGAADINVQFKETIKNLEFELAQLERSEFGKRFHAALRGSGAEGETIFDPQVKQIFNLTARIQTLTDKKKEDAKAQQEQNKAEAEGKALKKSLQTADEEYIATLERLSELRQRNAIDAETESRAIEQAERRKLDAATDGASGIKRAIRDLQEESADAATHMEGLFNNAFDGMTDAISEFVKTGKLDFASLADSIISDLIRIQLQTVLTDIMSGVITNIAPGFGGGNSAGGGPVQFAHSGGVAGAPGAPKRNVPAAAFANAPRFHGGGFPGLGPGEVPVVAKRGEVIGWPAQMREAFGGVDVQIIDQRSGGEQPQVSSGQGPDGRQQIRILLADEVNRGIREGRFDSSFSQTFGLTRRGGGR